MDYNEPTYPEGETMLSTFLKIVAKGWLAIFGLLVMSVLAIYIIFAGLIAFVNLIVPG